MMKSCRTLELHAAPLQQDSRHQVCACAGRGEDVQNMMGVWRHQWWDYELSDIAHQEWRVTALRTEIKKVNISKSFHV